jgi:MFS transporter, FSR family, fosmidomycin resistance protein
LSESIEPQRKPDYRGLWMLCLGHMMTDLNTSALPAILPFLKEGLGLSYAMAGTIILFSNLTSSVIQPVFGYISDRKSFLWFLPFGIFCAALGISLLGWAASYRQIVFLVIVSGLGVAIYHPEGWRTANVLAGDKKATGMSIFGVGGNIGFALGPLMAATFVAALGLKGTAFFIAPGAVMAGIFLFTGFWRVARPKGGPAARTSAGASSGYGKSAVYPMSVLLAMVTLRSWAHIGLLTFIPFYYISHMKGDPMHAGNLLFAFLGSGTLGTIAGGPLADRFGHKKIMLLSLGISCPLLVLFLLSSGIWAYIWFMLAGFIMIFSFTVSIVMGQYFMPQKMGMASGLIVGLAIGTGGIGAAILGLVADRWGIPATLWIIAFIPVGAFILGAMIPYAPKKND